MKSTENRSNIVLLTGPRGTGKTTWVVRFFEYLRAGRQPAFGIATPKILHLDALEGIAVRDLSTGIQIPLALLDHLPGVRIGPWRFLPDAVAFANRACDPHTHTGIALIDEIGPLEMEGGGFQVALTSLKKGLYFLALLVVRPELVDEVREKILSGRNVPTIGPDADFGQALSLLLLP